MYWVAKIFQAAGLGTMGIGFIRAYPNMMQRDLLLVSVLFFAVGWIIQAWMLRK